MESLVSVGVPPGGGLGQARTALGRYESSTPGGSGSGVVGLYKLKNPQSS
jgi:hypothetical protein